MRSHLIIWSSTALLALLWAAAASAQEALDLRQETRTRDLDAPLEQGVADVSALGMSLRQIDPGLVAPTDFGEVYRVPGMPDMLMRIAGGVFAIFPQSVYSDGGAMIPPGTTFYIGAPPTSLPGGMLLPVLLPDTGDSGVIEVHDSPAAGPLVPAELTAGWSDHGAATIANNALYRRDRLRELMLEAAKQDTGREEGETAVGGQF